MPFTPVSHVAGATMVWADLATNFALARTWINEIPPTDVSSASVQREHLVRPVIAGWPEQGARSTFQAVARGTAIGAVNPPATIFTEWGPKIDRLTIRPIETGSTNESDSFARWITPIGKPIFTTKSMAATVICQFDLQVRSNPTGGPSYPTGAGAGDLAGDFRILVFDRQTNTETLRQLRTIYPLAPAAPAIYPQFIDRVIICTTFDLSAGYHDVALVYYRGTATLLPDQLDLSSLSLFVELL